MPSLISLKSAESSAKRRGQKSHLARFGIIRDSACQRRAMMVFAPFTVQCMPARLSRVPITTLQPLRI